MKHTGLKLCMVLLLLCATTVMATAPMSSECEPEPFAFVADDYHSNHNFVVGLNGHHWVSWSRSQSDGIYGDFEVTAPSSGADQIITFFICDEENYNLWDSGEAASVYHLQEHVASYSFHFRVPYADTWYFVFKNYALLLTKTINFDLYRDLTAPDIDMNLDTGATYSGIKEITATITEAQFDIETVRLYIDGVLKDTEYDGSFSYSWDTTQYSNGSTTTIMLGAVGLIAIIGIVIVASRRGKGGPAPADVFTPAPPPPDEPTPAPVKDPAPADEIIPAQRPSEESESTHFREKEVVTERFMVICPFCGAKNHQGIVKCQKCHADL
jgi:hypothetical protein